MPARTGPPGELGLEVDENGSGDVGIAVLDASAVRVGEIPADVEQPQAPGGEVRGELVDGDQWKHLCHASNGPPTARNDRRSQAVGRQGDCMGTWRATRQRTYSRGRGRWTRRR